MQFEMKPAKSNHMEKIVSSMIYFGKNKCHIYYFNANENEVNKST